jgi:large subunit ribosomal protein L25
MRKTGKMPGVMYNNQGQATSLTLDEAEFTKVRRLSTPTTLVNLTVDSKDAGVAFLKATEYDIKTDRNLHVDFHVIQADKPLKASIVVQFSGTPAGVREGGRLVAHATKIALECNPSVLPVRISEDISSLAIGSVLRVQALHLDKGITVFTDGETPLVSVVAGAEK